MNRSVRRNARALVAVFAAYAALGCRPSPPSMRYNDFVTLGGSFSATTPPPASLEVHRLRKRDFFAMTLTGTSKLCERA